MASWSSIDQGERGWDLHASSVDNIAVVMSLSIFSASSSSRPYFSNWCKWKLISCCSKYLCIFSR